MASANDGNLKNRQKGHGNLQTNRQNDPTGVLNGKGMSKDRILI